MSLSLLSTSFPCLKVRALLLDIFEGASCGIEDWCGTNTNGKVTWHGLTARIAASGDQFFPFNTQYGMGLSLEASLPGDLVVRVEGTSSLFLLRPLSDARLKIVSTCYWKQLRSPDDSTWVGTITDAVQNASEQTRTFKIY